MEAVRGYRIPFSSQPPARACLHEPRFSTTATEACDREIRRLILKGAIEIAVPSANQYLSRFFLIEKASGGIRFILNLKELNSYLAPPRFQLEDWRMVIQLLTKNAWMTTIDLEDAYLLVPIAPEDRRFLRFQWRGILYEFTALPFGLSTAPYIFTKILRPVVAHLRGRGLCSIIYLDDFLIIGASKEDCSRNLSLSLDLLSSFGFIINYSKSQLDPSQRCKYLGSIFNSVHQSISIPPKRRKNLLKMISAFSAKSKCQIKDFASMIGSLISICPAVQYGLLYTKEFEREKFLALTRANGNYEIN